MKLEKVHVIKGKLICMTGLHIGGNADAIEIGGIDNPVIKHPISGEPYIPGSSLKGKMRSQMEKKEGKTVRTEKKWFDGKEKIIEISGEPCGCGKTDCMVCRIFGPHKNSNHKLGPTRILVRDALLSEESRQEMISLMHEQGKSYIEVKTENVINRNVGTAQHPRTQERVPQGTRFDMEIVIQEFCIDKGYNIVDYVKEALKSVEESYLGGSGSRGYGKVKFESLEIDGNPITL